MIRWPAAAACLVAMAAGAAANADGAGPVWAIQGPNGGTVYLAGSVHVLDPAQSRLPPGFDTAYRDAEQLVMEIDFDDLDELAAGEYLAANGFLADGETLRTLLGPARFERLDREARKLGLPLDSVATLEPWAVAMGLLPMMFVKLDLDPALGVERQLVARALADGKPIGGLETIEEQLAVLDGLSLEDQATFLEQTLDELDAAPTEVRRMIDAWRRADTGALAHLLLDEYGKAPALYGALVTARNQRWIPQIVALLARPDDTLVVVGALHLVGEDGLLELLERRGITPRALGSR
ncbi:MAG TPA: TraB/GumN family protein [Steroidobacteraceae bacterium]|nr:TraB/GumN family protein [Steroidobacteraceae bacterium]